MGFYIMFPNDTIAYVAGLVTGIVGLWLVIRGFAQFTPSEHECEYCNSGD